MDSTITQDVLLGQLRTALAVIGGIVVAKGYIDSGTATMISGIIVALAPFAWSALSKWQAEKAAKAREAVAFNSGIIKADNTVGPTPLVPLAEVAKVIQAIAPTLPAGLTAPAPSFAKDAP